MKNICFILTYYTTLGLVLFSVFFSCTNRQNQSLKYRGDVDSTAAAEPFYYGIDLSYVNEMEDCGAIYKDENNQPKEVYEIFQNEGANLVRYRLWVDPTWTHYSTLSDVKKSIRRGKNAGFKVLLDLHYSDTWADPGHQEIPASWMPYLNDTEALSQQLYAYTYEILDELKQEKLLPDIVQVGNEINGSIVTQGNPFPIDWNRNASLLNNGIQAVRDFSTHYQTKLEVMLHIAQPENGLWWFEQATQNGITDYDWIGLSYYPEFSTYTLQDLEQPIASLINTYAKKLMIVETAYPYTLDNSDSANNILGASALLSTLSATQQGQLDYLNKLTSTVKQAGGLGVVYWEPAWIVTNCKTLWATGSHWDNATLFDPQGKATLGIQFLNGSQN